METMIEKNRKVNNFNTPLDDSFYNGLSKEIVEDINAAIDEIIFIQRLIDPNIPTVRDLERDELGRVIVDITRPHKLENMRYFTPAADHYRTHKCYTLLPPNNHPKSPYKQFWKEERRRIKEGYVREDGEWVPGRLYWYWNYCPILKTKRISANSKRSERINDFGDKWLGDYLWFHHKYQAAEEGKHVEMMKVRGIGNEQPVNEIVITPSGEKRFGDVKAGDYIMNPDGFPTKVAEVYPQGLKDVYTIKLMDGRVVKCGENHLWEVINGRKKEVLKTCELISNGLTYPANNGSNVGYKYKLPKISPIKFSEKVLPVDPYILGALLGDGTITGCTPRIASDDSEIISNIQFRLGDKYVLNRDKSSNNYNIVCLENKGIWNKVNLVSRGLKEIGLFGKKHLDKFIPDIYKYSSIDQRISLVKGLMDTDGYINTRGAIEFSNTSLTLVNDLAFVLRSLGINCNIGKCDNRVGQEKIIVSRYRNARTIIHKHIGYRLHINTSEPIFSLKRKLDRINNNPHRVNTSIVAITKENYKEDQMCILVENENHLYITKDFIPTHNSFKGGSEGPYNALFKKKSKTFYVAADMQYLTKDGVISKAWDYLDFLAEHTPFPRLRLRDTILEKEIGYKDMRSGAERGMKSSIIGLSTKDDPDKVRGKRGDIFFEEYGAYPQIKKAWDICRASVEDGENVFAQLTAGGTGGTVGADFEGAEDMFYNPDSYNILAVDNVYDRNTHGNGKCGFFWGAYLNRANCYDEDGNPDVTKALKELFVELDRIKRTSSEVRKITQRRAEYPITPQDSMMKVDGTIFPVADIRDALEEIMPVVDQFVAPHYIGDLIFNKNGIIEWRVSDGKPIREFPLKDNKIEGCLEIFERPNILNGEAERNRYIAGIDPYDDDASSTVSLGSVFILDLYTDRIVAEYTGRPKFANDFYETCRRLLLYYNAVANYENDKKGLFQYFDRKNSLYLLTDTLQSLKDVEMVKGNLYGNKGKGTNSGKIINATGRRMLAEYMMSQAYNEDPNVTNLRKIRSIGLLLEALKWNPDGNYDRISACGMLMLLRADKQKYIDNSRVGGERVIAGIQFDSYFLKNSKGTLSHNTDKQWSIS